MKTIIQQIQPECDELWIRMKEAKNTQGRSNHDIAEQCGIPESSVKNFFAGNTANPCVYYVAAACKYLDLSIDELMGISHANENLKDQKKDLEYLQKINEMQEETIRHLRLSHKAQRTLILCLMALCMLLMIPIFIYISLDAKDPEVGFIVNGQISSLGFMFVATTVIIIYSIYTVISKAIKTKKKEGEVNDDKQH